MNKDEILLELIQESVFATISNIKRTRDISPYWVLWFNVLWKWWSSLEITNSILEKTQQDCATRIDFVVAWAWLPIELAEIWVKHKTSFIPIVSSLTVFQSLCRSWFRWSLWKENINKFL